MKESSHRDIVKSTAVVGGSQVISILLSIVRTKVLAVLLGPAGMGISGLLSSTTGVASTVFGLGIRNSGVREIAAAMGDGDEVRIAKAVTALRRVTLLTGLGGGVIFAILAFPLARWTFGDSTYGYAFLILSSTMLLGQLSAGQSALIQGTRRIGDLARLTVLGALFGTVFSIPFIYVWGTNGIAPYMAAVSLMSLGASWWYARKIQVKRLSLSLSETWREARPLVRLGMAFMISGAMTTGTTYAIRVIVSRKLGLEALGLYQAAWTLASLYVGVVITAMGQDFYPRLTAGKTDETRTRLVNEQALVGLLIAAPGVLATLVVAPLVVRLLYSEEFTGAISVLQWQIMGDILRVIGWPMGYVLVAKGKAKIFFFTELGSNVLVLSLSWIGLVFFGLEGLGIGFFGVYAVLLVGMYVLLHNRYGFVWSGDNLRLWLVVLPVVVVAFLSAKLLPSPLSEIVGGVVTVGLGYYCLRELGRALGESTLSLLRKVVHKIVPRRKSDKSE